METQTTPPVFQFNSSLSGIKFEQSTDSWGDEFFTTNTNFLDFPDATKDDAVFVQSYAVSSGSSTPETAYVSSPETFTSESSPESYVSSSSPSPNASPDGSFSFDHTLSFGEQPLSAFVNTDPSLFSETNLSNPLLVPEIEKILATTGYTINIQSSPTISGTSNSNKKRNRDDEGASDVTLSRERLLTMTSAEIEDYVSSIKNQRPLTVSEEKDLKRQRRLVKNREYASQSRNRKKQYVDEIEAQLATVRAENSTIKLQNKALIEENKMLKNQLENIATAIKKSQVKAAPLSVSSGAVNSLFKIGSSSTNGRNNHTGKTVSVCLLAMLFMVFTFGALWEKQPYDLFPVGRSVTLVTRNLKAYPSFDVPCAENPNLASNPLNIEVDYSSSVPPVTISVAHSDVRAEVETLVEQTPLSAEPSNSTSPQQQQQQQQPSAQETDPEKSEL